MRINQVNARARTWNKMCLSKKRYLTLKFAQEVADKAQAERGVTLRPYPCRFCQDYHLTSKTELDHNTS